jgi:hypothetical protein
MGLDDSSGPANTVVPNSRAVVVGAGPNGLAAAIVLAQAGMQVEVFEAEAQPGGGARTMELTLPGFHHDFGSAVHPMAVGSPFFSSLPLQEYGLEWIYSPSVVAHPLDDGTAVLLERNLADAVREFGEDGPAWEELVGPLAGSWTEVAPELLSPLLRIPRHPLRLAKFGLHGLPSAKSFIRGLGGTLFSCSRRADDCRCRIDLRHHRARRRVADPAGRVASNYECSDRVSAEAEWSGDNFAASNKCKLARRFYCRAL